MRPVGVKPGDEFKFTFDLGDDWVHCCTGGATKVDPIEVLGIRPKAPLPPCPAASHPMASYGWPGEETLEPFDLGKVRADVIANDPEAFLAEISGKYIEEVLQQVGLENGMQQAEAITAAVYNMLSRRSWPGDRDLAEDLLARLRHQPLTGEEMPVSLDELWAMLGAEGIEGVYIDRETGTVNPNFNDELVELDLEEVPGLESRMVDSCAGRLAPRGLAKYGRFRCWPSQPQGPGAS